MGICHSCFPESLGSGIQSAFGEHDEGGWELRMRPQGYPARGLDSALSGDTLGVTPSPYLLKDSQAVALSVLTPLHGRHV